MRRGQFHRQGVAIRGDGFNRYRAVCRRNRPHRLIPGAGKVRRRTGGKIDIQRECVNHAEVTAQRKRQFPAQTLHLISGDFQRKHHPTVVADRAKASGSKAHGTRPVPLGSGLRRPLYYRPKAAVAGGSPVGFPPFIRGNIQQQANFAVCWRIVPDLHLSVGIVRRHRPARYRSAGRGQAEQQEPQAPEKRFHSFLREKLTKQVQPCQSFTENTVLKMYSKERRTEQDHWPRQDADFDQHR